MRDARKTCNVMDAGLPGVPYYKPCRTWAGHGSGARCDLCGLPIDPDQIEYEVELPPDACDSVLNLHLACYEAWSAPATEE
jgi:hypothetical protein